MQFLIILFSVAVISVLSLIIILKKKNAALFLEQSISDYAEKWFNLLKWLFLVAAITFVAEINENIVIQIIAGFSYLVLYFYIIFNIFALLRRKNIIDILSNTINRIINKVKLIYHKIFVLPLERDELKNIPFFKIYKEVLRQMQQSYIYIFYLDVAISIISLLFLVTVLFYLSIHELVIQIQNSSPIH
jgi:hypothetical protein